MGKYLVPVLFCLAQLNINGQSFNEPTSEIETPEDIIISKIDYQAYLLKDYNKKYSSHLLSQITGLKVEAKYNNQLICSEFCRPVIKHFTMNINRGDSCIYSEENYSHNFTSDQNEYFKRLQRNDEVHFFNISVISCDSFKVVSVPEFRLYTK